MGYVDWLLLLVMKLSLISPSFLFCFVLFFVFVFLKIVSIELREGGDKNQQCVKPKKKKKMRQYIGI